MPSTPDGMVKRWLMERVGHEEAPLREVWVAPIAQLFLDGEWDESDIVKTHVGRDGAKEVWSKILDACLKKVGEVSDIQRAKALRSLLTLSPLYSSEAVVVPSLTASRLRADVESDPPYVPPDFVSPPRCKGKATTEPAPTSNEEREDLDSQGAATLSQLYALSVGIQLAKKASVSECTGGGYGSSPHMADGVKRAVKGQMVILQKLLEEGMMTGDLLNLDRHINRTVQRWMADPSDAFYMNAGSRLMMVWSKARALRPNDMRVAACMVHLMLDEYLGRGIPKLVDTELAQQARDRYPDGSFTCPPPDHPHVGSRSWGLADTKPVGEFGYPQLMRDEQADARSDSSLVPSASAVQSSTSTALQTSLDGLAKLVAERFDQSAAQAKTMSDRLNRVESRHGELAVGGYFSVPPRTVWICCFLPISRIPCLGSGSRIGGLTAFVALSCLVFAACCLVDTLDTNPYKYT